MSSILLVATLIADPARPLSEATLDRAAQALEGIERRRWLGADVAADIVCTDELEPRRAAIEAAFADEPFDVIVQPLAGREKRLLVADMDSTLIGQECVDELAAHAGVGAHVASITEQAMCGDIAFEPALRKRVALLAGLPETVIDEVLASRIMLNLGARTLVQTMRARGARVVVVSEGFRPFTRAVAGRLRADEDHGNELEIADAMGLDLSQTLAIGDGANDLAMLAAAGLGVAYRAKPRVAAAAHARVDHGDLTALLYAQGNK